MPPFGVVSICRKGKIMQTDTYRIALYGRVKTYPYSSGPENSDLLLIEMQNSAGAGLRNLATRKEEEMKKMKFSIFIVRPKYE